MQFTALFDPLTEPGFFFNILCTFLTFADLQALNSVLEALNTCYYPSNKANIHFTYSISLEFTIISAVK